MSFILPLPPAKKKKKHTALNEIENSSILRNLTLFSLETV